MALAAASAVAGASFVMPVADAEQGVSTAATEYLSDVLRDWRKTKQKGTPDVHTRLELVNRAFAVAEVAVGRERYEALRFISNLGIPAESAELLSARDRALARVLELYIDDGDIMGEFVLRVLRENVHDRTLRAEAFAKTHSDSVRAACEFYPIESLLDRALEGADLTAADRDKALAALSHIVQTYGQSKHPLSAKAWGEFASSAAISIRELILIGEAAPEIAGNDAAGNGVRMSALRGKAVLLCFWGDWCAPCRTLYARQREIAASLADRPFTILGINSDVEQSLFNSVCAKEQFRWANLWDGAAGTAGAFATRWHVRIWPTWYLIDAQGIVRQRWLGAPEAAELEGALAAWIPKR